MKPGAPILHGESAQVRDPARPRSFSLQKNSNVLSIYHAEQGDIAAGFKEADEIFEDVYSSQKIQHAHIEPHAALAYWEPSGKLVIYTSTQNPSSIRAQLAELFNLPQSKVRVIVPYVGGGYGGKVHPRLEPLTAALARKAHRPVQWVLSREEVFLTAHCHASVVKIKTGVKRDGTIVARHVEGFYDTGAYALTGPSTTKNGGEVSGGPYRIAHQDLTTYCVYTNTPPTGPYRGFGVPQVCWAYESQMDDIARRLGMDPLELRLKNLVQEGDQFVTGDTLVSVGISECLKGAAQAVGWQGKQEQRKRVKRKSAGQRAGGDDQDDDDAVELIGAGQTQRRRLGGFADEQCGDRAGDADLAGADRGRGVGDIAGASQRDVSRHRCDAV